ncbi:hypothetical protein MTR67_020465 [Solanum verrucosum]|uniref:Uncharacterized protein n=1 Tax=Solanum verrucosum TaxID=315347 RepID=A0AAF0QR37_SOLVR|nr:hypothetical protein MTR67_020465 [Solanum verrucosum]
MSIASGLVEAYVMKKLHKEKMKNPEKKEATTHENSNLLNIMSSASAYLAEAYVTRKQFKEKVMKKMDNNYNEVADIKKLKNSSSSSSSSGGGNCFSPMKLIFKRVHPNTTAAMSYGR